MQKLKCTDQEQSKVRIFILITSKIVSLSVTVTITSCYRSCLPLEIIVRVYDSLLVSIDELAANKTQAVRKFLKPLS